jgi:hypothetical protein
VGLVQAERQYRHHWRSQAHPPYVAPLRPPPQAKYVLLQPRSLAVLQRRLRAAVLANPPLGYEPEGAVAAVSAEAAAEVAAGEAARERGVFDAVVEVDLEVRCCGWRAVA